MNKEDLFPNHNGFAKSDKVGRRPHSLCTKLWCYANLDALQRARNLGLGLVNLSHSREKFESGVLMSKW